MKRGEEEEIDQLLARGQFSAPALERILQKVEASRQPASWLRRSFVVFGAPAVAAAGLALLLSTYGARDSFQSKGEKVAASAVIECSQSSGGRCAQSEFVVIRAMTSRPAYLQAYAESLTPGGDRVWFLAGEDLQIVTSDSELRPIDRVVRLQSVPPGSYRVHLVLSPKPLARDEVLGASADVWRRVIPLEVTP
jgi:hypothetical protein